jgi:hypothetical protein
MDSDPGAVVEAYLSKGQRGAARGEHPAESTCGDRARVRSIEITNTDARTDPIVPFDEPIRFRVEHEVTRPLRNLDVVVRISDMSGTAILSTGIQDLQPEEITQPGTYTHTFEVPGALLRPGRYLVSTVAKIRSVRLDEHEHILGFDVIADQAQLRPGVILPRIAWTTEPATQQIAANR